MKSYQPSRPLLLLLVSICLWQSVTAAQLDYHLEKTIHLSNMNENIGNITNFVSLKNGNAAFLSTKLPQTNGTIFGGQKFDEEVFSFSEKDVIAQPRFGVDSVIINKGYFGYANNYGRSTNVPGLNISGNIISKQRQTLFSESRKCPTLTTYSYFYNSLSSKTFGNQSQCNFYSAGYLTQHNDKYILYAAINKLYLLRYTQLYEQYTQILEKQQNKFASLESFYWVGVVEGKSLEKFVAVLGLGMSRWYRVLRKEGDMGFLADQYAMYSPMEQFYINGLDSAVSFNGNYMYRWQKLSNGIKALEWQDENQHLPGFTLCISNDETQIFQVQKNKLSIYSFIEGNITKTYEHVFENISSIIQGKVNKKNQFLLFNAYISDSEEGFTIFCKMMLNDTSVVCSQDVQRMEDSEIKENKSDKKKQREYKWERFGKLGVDQNGYLKAEQLVKKTINTESKHHICLQWTFSTSYSRTDSLTALCLNTTSWLYELHSYSIETLELRKSSNIYIGDLGITPTAVKLVQNQYQQEGDQPIVDRSTFLLVFKIEWQWDNDQAYTIRIKQEYENQFIRDGPPSRELGFWNIYAYGKYIANFKYRNSTVAINKLRFFQYLSFRLLEEIDFDEISTYERYHFNGYRNVLMLNQNFGNKGSYVYNLKKVPGQPDFFKGVIHAPFQHSWSIIFPKSNIFYTYRAYPEAETDPLKLVIDISTLPIKEVRKMQTQQNIQLNNIQVLKYLKIQPLIIGRQCEVVFFITNNQWLHKYEDCGTQRKTKKYRLQNKAGNQTISYKNIYESASKESIVIESQQIHPRRSTLIEVREIENPQKIIWKQNKTQQNQTIQHIAYLQSVYGTSVEKIYETKLADEPIQDVINASYYYFVKFTDINVQQTCSTILGQAQQNEGKDALIWYDGFMPNQKIFKSHVGASNIYIPGEHALAVENVAGCKYIATYTNKGFVLVWGTVPDLQLKINITRKDIQSIKFSGDSKIAIKTKNSLQILDIPVNQTSSTPSPSSSPSSPPSSLPPLKIDGVQKYALSQDGQISALVTDRLTVQILTTKSEEIRTFIIPSNSKDMSIVDLSFSEDNKLLITASNFSVFVLAPTPCPQPFINKNGICSCPQNQVVVGNGCECVNRFVRKDGVCVCDDRQFVYNAGTCGCSKNATQVQSKCQCLQNFIKNGPFCSCINSFQFNQDKLTCECPYGYIDKQQCISCSFPCSTCSKGVSSCDSFSATFYLLIIGAAIIFIVLVGVVVFCVRKKKLRKENKSGLLKEELEKD